MSNTAPEVHYSVRHETHYDYALPVSLSQQVLHLQPRPLARQRLLDWQLASDPAPSRRLDGLDPWGNPVSQLDYERPHERLTLTSTMRVAITPRPAFDPLDSPAWESVLAGYRHQPGQLLDAAALEPQRFRFASPYVPFHADFAAYAVGCFPRGRPLLDAAHALMRQIHRDFRFDSRATAIDTPLTEVLARRRGVCQDYAHLMIGCLRALGFAARYLSGYLLTLPPPGKPRLIGADASHAWVAVHCPRQGWIEFDPTNDVVPDTQHILLGWGRDFADVSPLRGVILGGGAHSPRVSVHVEPEAAG
jgi:transglutaminase-like putative cysteine protease